MSRILFIAPRYFNYHSTLMNEMTRQGHVVDFLPDTEDTFCTLLLKRLSISNDNSFHERIRQSFVNNSYDIFLVIGGRRLTPTLIKELKTHYKSVKFIMYQWDSLNNFDFRGIAKYFDSVRTFDSLDASLNNWGYLPLFYTKNPETPNSKIDLLFIGIWHSDRIEILNKVHDSAIKNGLVCDFRVFYPYYMYLYLLYVKKLRIKSRFFIHNSVPLAEVQKLYSQSRCIIDISHPQQSGLTMRAIEALGNGKKLLTTNRSIVGENFYNKNQIQVFDRDKWELDLGFINNNFENSELISDLEICNWVKNLIDGR